MQQLATRFCIKVTCGFDSTCICCAVIQDAHMMRGGASIKPDDIVNGSREATLGLLWSAFLQFQASWLEPFLKKPLKLSGNHRQW